MAPKPEFYRWLGSSGTRSNFCFSVGIHLREDVNGCIGIGRKAGGEEWLAGFRQKLRASPGTRLVPRKVQVIEVGPQLSPVASTKHPRLLSPRTCMNTKVVLAKARITPNLPRVAIATHTP